MFKKSVAVAKAAAIKSAVDAHEAAIAALPDGPEKAAVVQSGKRLHAWLNGLAHRAADFFDEDPSTFSGGTDKPQEN